jgi:DNA-binding response OmpR family regulator
MARIIIVEDEADLCELYRLALEARGHQVVGVYREPDDLLKATLGAPPPQLLVLDERLGWKSGAAQIPRFRQKLPGVIILLASADPDAIDAGEQEGPDAVMKKPFPLANFVDRIEELTAG